jgi:hypothetical protein
MSPEEEVMVPSGWSGASSWLAPDDSGAAASAAGKHEDLWIDAGRVPTAMEPLPDTQDSSELSCDSRGQSQPTRCATEVTTTTNSVTRSHCDQVQVPIHLRSGSQECGSGSDGVSVMDAQCSRQLL